MTTTTAEAAQESPMPNLVTLRKTLLDKIEPLKPFALLAGRLGVGLVFVSTGWGKLHNLEGVTKFFTELGIPAPGFNALLAATTEFVCGAALVVGAMTRLATIPLIVTMIVAILTAKRKDLHGPLDLVGFDEFTYIVVMFMIAVLGPGRYAVDHILARKFGGASEKP